MRMSPHSSLVCSAGGAAGRPSEGADARAQLGEGEGLGEVVIRAGFQPLHALLHLAQRRQHQHRRADARGAQRAQDGEPVRPWQHAVRHDHVEGFVEREEEAVPPIARDVHHHALFAEALGDVVGRRAIVLDHQDAHGVA
jgi:hypothetical protein